MEQLASGGSWWAVKSCTTCWISCLTVRSTCGGHRLGLRSGEALYEEIDAEAGRSNIDIEKHLRRAELKLAEANAWLAMARELGWQRDDYGGRPR
jgi:hypothetical protein